LAQILLDRGKLGTKRHILIDQKGVPLSVTITGADIHDMKASTDTLDKLWLKDL
jgi:transposase